MRNANRTSITFYEDVETKQKYEEWKKEGYREEEIMKTLSLISRDNARIPMQWNTERHHGFTDGTPWLADNVDDISMKKDKTNKDGYFNIIKKQ